MLNNFFFNHVINVEKRSAGQATDDNMMRIACCIPEVTNMLEICNAAFPLQQ